MSVAQPLRISYIELRSAQDVESIEVLFHGCRRSIRRQDKNYFREEFPEPLTVQGQALSFSVHWKRWYSFCIPAVNNVRINVRDVLSNSRSHKFQTERSKLDITIGLSSDHPPADVVPTQANSTPLTTDSLRPATEALLDQCPRFRILVIGQSGVGKSTLIQRAFELGKASAENFKQGNANIKEELISPQNDRFVLHDSNGFEPHDHVNRDAVKSFIADRKRRELVKDQLHAIWLCFRIPIPGHGERLLEDGAETFLKEDTSVLQNIPTVVVFTKYDKLLTHMLMEKEADPEAAAKQYLQKHCIDPIAKLAGGTDLSYVAVSSNVGLEQGYKRLIGLTHQKVTETFRFQLNTSSPVSVLTPMEQRVLLESKIQRSIDVGKQRYWMTLISGVNFTDHTITDCLAVIHTDIVRVWNFNDPSQYLCSNEFRGLMANLAGTIDESTPASPGLARVVTTSLSLRTGLLLVSILPSPISGRLAQWAVYQVYKRLPKVHRKFVAYIVDLVHVLEILFSLATGNDQRILARGAVSSAFKAYYDSEMRRNVHRQIDGFNYETPRRDAVLDRIVSLVNTSLSDNNDISIAFRRSALQLTPQGHPERVVSLVNLADSLRKRFKRQGGMEDLQEIIDLRRSALQLIPEGHPGRIVFLADLVDSLHERFKREDGVKDLQEIIDLQCSVLKLTPEGHPERVVFLINLADSLHERFKRESGMEDLQEIIALRRSALQLTPEGHPERVVFLANLVDNLHERFERESGVEDLQEIIDLQHSALKLTPEGDPERVMSLVNLADNLCERFKREGGMEDLQEIVALRRSALKLTPEGHPDCVLSLVNLADGLHERFKRESGMEDLQEIIDLRRSALQLTPEGHPGRVVSLVNLADSLHERFKRESGMEDLQEIVDLRRSALQFTPEGHPGRVASLVNLADNLHERFKRESGMEDLQEIITLQRSALQLIPEGYPEFVVSLVNLLDSLHERFKRESGMEDLQEIITLQRSALQFTPPGHPGRFLSLVNLSNSLHGRFIKGGTLADLDEIIAFRRAASECTAPTPSDRCMLLLDLANSLREKYQKLGLDADLGEAIKYACAASVGCPSEQDASCRDCVASCVQLKAKKSRLPAPAVQAIDSPVRPSGVQQIVQSIVAKIIQTLPLRLLNTYTGTLCDRDAQISCFEDSVQYKELQSFTCDNPESELYIRNAISKYFGYTTLSHRWGAGEPLLRNVQGVNIYSLDDREGFAKLQSFCAFTLQHGYRWAWSDTCCIDKDSSSELQEAIGSMFVWYRNSALTIVHLADVSGTTSFADSIWFKRGWTLQELLASPRVLFYTQDWSLYMNCASPNHKSDAAILAELQEATGIAELQLKNFSPGVLDVRSKLQWASTRYTTRAEDVAYSLFGIFQVSLPVIYGENTPGALGRLLAEIVSRSGDVSVLDWVGEASSFHSCFPTGLTPYRTRSWMQSVPSGPSKHHDVDLEKGRDLYNALARLSSPRFVAGRLELPCIVHRVASVKLLETSSVTSYHDYELVASGLVPLKLKLSSRLQEGSGAGLPYVLVRPWSPKLLDLLARDDVPGSLLEWLRQPFSALLLQSPLHTEYKRIATDCSIIASVEDLASVVHSECQTLEIV